MENKIKIITPFYNPGKYLDSCVSSLITQKYDNYQIIFIDDCSTDGSWDKLPHNDKRAICIKNETRKTALENLHNAFINHCKKDDIVVLVDGDDWLSTKNALSTINDFYNEHNCWVSWGQAMWTTGQKGIARPFPNKEMFNQLRKVPQAFHYISHMRSFRGGLYHKIKEQDLEYKCLRDNNGEFYKMTYDVAIFLVLMELAGFENVKYNDKVLYIYNRDNVLNDDKVNQNLQTSIHLEILKKPAFKKIENYK
jgi:glycosyltransferase involved in cell wall biosynthesis